MAETTITLKSIFISYLAFIFASISTTLMCQSQPLSSTTINGFTTDLIHRDSPDSPFFDPSSTPPLLLASAVQHSLSRAKHLNETSTSPLYSRKDAESIIISTGVGPYLMRFSIGTPAQPVIAVMDTGSHITWTQCLPCDKCIKQRLAIFNPRSSYTYSDARCDSYTCDDFYPASYCDKRREKCLYTISYQDGSYSRGVVASDTFAFSSSTSRVFFFNKIKFACGHDNKLAHLLGSASGVVGLAGGGSSLVRQLGYDRFSYCLMPWKERFKTSKLHFGADAAVSGRGVVSTRLTVRNTYYYLQLEAISVGNKRIEYHNPFLVVGGNIIIDSGSVLTFLPEKFYDQVEVAIANSISQRAVRDFEEWRVCYSSRIVMPRIIVHFKGADVEWKFENVFVRVNEDYMCLAMVPMQGVPIYGNIAQANFMVGYDLAMHTLSFKQTQCGI